MTTQSPDTQAASDEAAPQQSEAAHEAAAPAATPEPTSAAAAPEQPTGESPASAGSDESDEGDGDGETAEAGGESTEGGGAAEGERKKRKRKRGGRNRKKGEGATAEAGAPGEGGEAAATEGGAQKPEGAQKKEGGPKKDRRPQKDHKGPPHERAAFHVGEEVFGKVTSVTEDAIMVDLSGKALGIFDRHELAADDLVPEVGDRFVASVHGDGTRGGFVVLTRNPLREEQAKPRVEEAAKSGGSVKGLVTGVVKGGVEVDVDGLRAFAPASHMDLRLGADLAHFIGQRLEFQVAQFAKRGRDVVVSRKSLLEGEAKESRKAALSKLEPGTVVKGVVRTIVPYGAFISIPSADDVEGLVHMTEASHDRGARLGDVLKPGQEVDVKVLKIDDKGKLWLSHKAAIQDPWAEAAKQFTEGSRHKGKVVRLQPFGAFIELAPAIDGLLHTSDLSFKPIESPEEVLKIGDEIDVVVAGIDVGARRIKLHPAPPPGEENEPRQKLAPHKVLKVAVVSAESAGLIVRVIGMTGRSARGFIPAGQTGTERGTDLRKHFPVGAQLEAKVLEIDPRRGEAKLSLRAVKDDREKAAYNEYRQSVAKASKFGTLGDLLAKKL